MKDRRYQRENAKSVINLPDRRRKEITASVVPAFTEQWRDCRLRILSVPSTHCKVIHQRRSMSPIYKPQPLRFHWRARSPSTLGNATTSFDEGESWKL